MATENENEVESTEEEGQEQEQQHEPGSEVVEIEEDEPKQAAEADDDEEEPEQDEPRETRKERRERKLQEKIRAEADRIVQERLSSFQRQAPPPPPQESRPDPYEAKLEEARKRQNRIVTIIRNGAGLPDDVVQSLEAEYHELENERQRVLVERHAAKMRGPSPDEIQLKMLPVMMKAQYGKLWDDVNLRNQAWPFIEPKVKGGMSPLEAVVEGMAEFKAKFEAAQKAKARPAPQQAAKYGSTRPEGAPSSGGKVKVVISKSDREKALSTYSHKQKWTDEQKIATWVKNQRKLEKDGLI